jgi:hypothetical protein
MAQWWENQFNPLPQAQNEQQNFMSNYSAGQYGGGNNNAANTINGLNQPNSNTGLPADMANWQHPGQPLGQQPRYNTDQGMNNNPWGQYDLNNLAGPGDGGGQPQQQSNPWDSGNYLTGQNGWANQLGGSPTRVGMGPFGGFDTAQHQQDYLKNPADQFGMRAPDYNELLSFVDIDKPGQQGQFNEPYINAALRQGYVTGNPGAYALTQLGRSYLTQLDPQHYGNQIGSAMQNLASQAPSSQQGQQQPNPYSGGAPAYVTNPQNNQDWVDKWYYDNQGPAGANVLHSAEGQNMGMRNAQQMQPYQQQAVSQRAPGNYYGQGGAQGFNELSGQLAQNGDRFKDAFGKFGWNLVTPQGGSQGQAENIARAMAAQNPNVDYEPVDMGGGVWNIATRSRLPGGGQPYSGLLPQPVMPPPVAPAQRYSSAPQRYSSGGGGGSNYHPTAQQPRPTITPQQTQNIFAGLLRAVPNLVHNLQPTQQGQIINSPFGGRQVVNGYGQGVPISNVPSSGT